MKVIKLLIMPRYTSAGPSSRIRFYQYEEKMRQAGIECDFFPFFEKVYVSNLFDNKKQSLISIFQAYYSRLITLTRAKLYDLLWFEGELFPWLPAWGSRYLYWQKIPNLVDFDDAIFHRYDTHKNKLVQLFLGKKIDHVMKLANVVLAGNEYIANHAILAGSNRVEIVPSVVDLQNYQMVKPKKSTERPLVIGWIGSPITIKYLLLIEGVIKEALNRGFRFLIVGAKPPTNFSGYPIDSRIWTLENEVNQIQEFDIGIMPLADLPFENGKCGYKLIQYMACGLPVVASPVGINKQLITNGENGFLATTTDEWLQSFEILRKDASLRISMGRNGRKLVEEKYSLQVNSSKLIKLIKEII